MTRRVLAVVVLGALLTLPRQAGALIYLGEHSLESLLVRCPVVVIATVVSTDVEADQAGLRIDKALKGEAKGEVTAKGLLLRVTATEKRPRLVTGERAIVFMGEDAAAQSHGIVYSYRLSSDGEIKSMEGCVAEIMPHAQVLADLGNMKKEVDERALKEVVGKLVGSDNGFTQILAGRLMGTSLSQREKPEGWDDIILAALESKRKELRKGALVWAGKYQALPPKVRAEVEAMTHEKGEGSMADEARKVLTK